MQFYMPRKLVLILYILLNTHGVFGNDPPGTKKDDRAKQSTHVVEEETQNDVGANYIISPKLSHCSSINDEDLFCHFYIDDVHRPILKWENEIKYIKFNNDQLVLDEEAKLPSTYSWSFFSIYAHKRKIPTLIQLISSKKRYFYSLNPKSKKWSNHAIDSLKEYQITDKNGVKCYKLKNENNFNEFHEKISEECLRLSEEKSDDVADLADPPTLEINLELTGLLVPVVQTRSVHFPRPKLELSSFRGEGNTRIQTYSLEVESPVARAILIHGYRNNFRAEFLNYNPKYFDNLGLGLSEYRQYHMDAPERNIKLKYKYGEDLVSAEELKSMVDGQLKLEDITVDVYKDGIDGWATTDRYVYEGSAIQALNLNNISVHGLDLRSFGASESPEVWRVGRVRAMLDDFDNMSKDLITFVKIVKEKYNDGLPLYLIGLSMGGGTAIRALEIYGSTEKLVDGAVFIAPMIKIYDGVLNNVYKRARWLLRAIGTLRPKNSVETGERAVKEDYRSLLKTDDPYCPNTYTYLRTGLNLILGCNDSVRDINKMDGEIPYLFIHSINDDMCIFEGTEAFFNLLEQAKKKSLVRLRNVDHHTTTCYKYFSPLSEFISHWILNVEKDRKHVEKSPRHFSSRSV